MAAVMFRRGRIVALGNQPEAAPAVAARPRALVFLALLVALPFFGQSFHYVVDLSPTYYLSKAWPILTLPLAAYALVTVRLPWAWLYGVLLAYVLGLTPLLSMIYLGNGLIDALVTTAKSLPFLYYFAAAGFLALLRPSQDQVRRAIVVLGIGTFLLMGFLWLVVPASAYRIDAAESKLFLYETERGYRIFMPMFFSILTMFYLARRLFMRNDLLAGLGVVIGFALLILIFKQRTVIMAVALTIGWIAFRASRAWMRALLLAGGVTVAIAAGILLFGPALDRVEAALGASLSIRQTSIGLALDYIQSHPLVLMFGAGSITRLSQNTLSTMLGFAHFYLADIGWLGIIFEYGLAGAALILSAYLATLRQAATTAPRDEPLVLAMGDYVIYQLLTSAVQSLVFTPGEVALLLALLVYWAQARVGPAVRGQMTVVPGAGRASAAARRSRTTASS